MKNFRFENGTVGSLPKPSEWRPEIVQGFGSSYEAVKKPSDLQLSLLWAYQNQYLRIGCDPIVLYQRNNRHLAVFKNPNQQQVIKGDRRYPIQIMQIERPYHRSLSPDLLGGPQWHNMKLNPDFINSQISPTGCFAKDLVAHFPRFYATQHDFWTRFRKKGIYFQTGILLIRTDIISVEQRVMELEEQLKRTNPNIQADLRNQIDILKQYPQTPQSLAS